MEIIINEDRSELVINDIRRGDIGTKNFSADPAKFNQHGMSLKFEDPELADRLTDLGIKVKPYERKEDGVVDFYINMTLGPYGEMDYYSGNRVRHVTRDTAGCLDGPIEEMGVTLKILPAGTLYINKGYAVKHMDPYEERRAAFLENPDNGEVGYGDYEE
jgi:hypothetical protein